MVEDCGGGGDVWFWGTSGRVEGGSRKTAHSYILNFAGVKIPSAQRPESTHNGHSSSLMRTSANGSQSSRSVASVSWAVDSDEPRLSACDAACVDRMSLRPSDQPLDRACVTCVDWIWCTQRSHSAAFAAKSPVPNKPCRFEWSGRLAHSNANSPGDFNSCTISSASDP